MPQPPSQPNVNFLQGERDGTTLINERPVQSGLQLLKVIIHLLFSYAILTKPRSLTADGGVSAPVPKRPAVQMPDEYLPPNKILFLQNLPENTTQASLVELFTRWVISVP